MKIQIAKLNYLHMAPRKVRLLANVIKGLSVNEAEAQLMINPKKAGGPLLKLLRSAIANGKQKELKPENLVVKDIKVDQGPVSKRHMPRAQGRASLILKRSSHITLILAESQKPKVSRFKIVKPQKVSKRVKAGATDKETGAEKPRIGGKESAKPARKEGFMRKMFRRKVV